MKNFKDSDGKVWNVLLTVGTAKRVRDELDLDLVNAADGSAIEKLIEDPILLFDVLYVICKAQAEKAGINNAEEWGMLIRDGDVIEEATAAFLEALTDFFPAPRRAILTKALAKMKKLEAMGMEMMDKKLDSDELEQAMVKALGEKYTSAPEVSESIPMDSPSES